MLVQPARNCLHAHRPGAVVAFDEQSKDEADGFGFDRINRELLLARAPRRSASTILYPSGDVSRSRSLGAYSPSWNGGTLGVSFDWYSSNSAILGAS
jgi:hypothetical protein